MTNPAVKRDSSWLPSPFESDSTNIVNEYGFKNSGQKVQGSVECAAVPGGCDHGSIQQGPF